MMHTEGQPEEPLRYESSVVEDAGLLLSPLDNLMYEMAYMKTASMRHDEVDISLSDVIEQIKVSKIPKKDILEAIMGKPDLREVYGEHTEVFDYLTSF